MNKDIFATKMKELDEGLNGYFNLDLDWTTHIVSDHGIDNVGVHFHFINDTKWGIHIVHPGHSNYLISKIWHFEYDSFDFAPTFNANLNLSAPFLSIGIINIYAIVEMKDIPRDVQLRVLACQMVLAVKSNI